MADVDPDKIVYRSAVDDKHRLVVGLRLDLHQHEGAP